MTPVTGLPIDRRDGRLKVTGHARYAAEFDIDNLAHAVLVQSTVSHGMIAGFDLAAAQGVPGVLAILTPDNAPHLAPNQSAAPGNVVAFPLLQDNTIDYNGQHIAVVVADTLERAQYAASLVRVSYQEGEAAIRMADELAEAYPPKHFRNGSRPPDSRRGDPDAAWDAAPIRLDLTYTTPVEHHNPMEPHATIALWDVDRLVRLQRHPGDRRLAAHARDAVRHQARAGPGDLPVCRRRVWLQGGDLAACGLDRDGSPPGRPPGQARPDPVADVHLQRLPAANHPAPEDRRLARRPSARAPA